MDIIELNDINNQDKKMSEFIKKADMVDRISKNKQIGRPKKSENEKASEQVFINLNKQQKESLENYAKQFGLSVSAAIKMILIKDGIIWKGVSDFKNLFS